MSTTTNLGRVGMVLKGDYVSGTTYKRLDVVYEPTTKSAFVSKVDDNTSALTDTDAWMPIADVSSAIQNANNAADAANAAAQHSVRFDEAQTLTDAQKITARGNISVRSIADEDMANVAAAAAAVNGMAVKFSGSQSLTDAQKETARENISVPSVSEMGEMLAEKANVDGAYEGLTAGNAKQLVATVFEEDNAPYNFRTSGGNLDIGDRETDMLVGGTIAWNQLIKNGNFTEVYDWILNGSGYGSYTVQDNVATVVVGQSAVDNASTYFRATCTNLLGHVYLTLMDANPSVRTTIRYQYAGIANGTRSKVLTANTWQTYGSIVKFTSQSVGALFYINATKDLSAGDTILVKNAMLFDLTQMLGTTIADYVYCLEQATEGAGVAWFRKLFLKSYYPYNTGTLMSVKAASHDMVGFNQWDEEWELGSIDDNTGEPVSSNNMIRSKNFIPVIPNTQYYMNISTGYRFAYDSDKKFIRKFNLQTTPTPNNCRYIKFRLTSDYGQTYKHDICLNIKWDGERDGEYEPYVKRSYALDDDLELRGIPMLDANNNMYYDGDTYAGDGTVTRRYGIVDLGTLNWTSYSQYTSFIASVADKKELTGTVYNKGILASSYPAVNSWWTDASKPDKSISNGAGTYVIVKDSSYANAAAFKTAMSGVYLVYELATPTTESADPYQNPQIVDDFGTEEYVDTRDVAIPVGHETEYSANLRAKLEMAPNSPDGDGDYVVRQTNGTNEYVPVTYPVNDVQVDGTSVVQGGVANVPIASTTAPGAVKYSNSAAIVLDGNNCLKLSTASSGEIKQGVSSVRPFAVANQHEAAFYGLAKAAGDTSQSLSSNAIGTYTAEALVKIQKMLGIYQAPWELIRDDTFTHNADSNELITTDGDGQAFELTDVCLILTMPQQETQAIIGNYGFVFIYYGDGATDRVSSALGAKTINANSNVNRSIVMCTQTNGLVVNEFAKWTTIDQVSPIVMQNLDRIGVPSTPYTFNKILICNITGTMNYKLYGRRKWTA